MAGRPTKYNPEYCEDIISYVKNEPYSSLEGFCAEIDICNETLTNWRNEHPEFLGAVKRAKSVLAARAIKRLMKCGDEGTGNATANIFAVKNLADDWKDKSQSEITGANGGAIKSEIALDANTLDQIAQKANQLKGEF